MSIPLKATVKPHQAVANLPARILNGTHQTVMGARATKGQQHRPWFGDAQGCFPERRTRQHHDPSPTHERKAIRRIANHRIHVSSRPSAHHVQAVAQVQRHVTGISRHPFRNSSIKSSSTSNAAGNACRRFPSSAHRYARLARRSTAPRRRRAAYSTMRWHVVGNG